MTDLRLLVQTWNMARESQINTDWARLFPEPHFYQLIVWGAQECVRGEKRVMADSLGSYLSKAGGFFEVGYVDMWEMFLVAFARRDTCSNFLTGRVILRAST